MPPVICFDHSDLSHLYLNPGLVPLAPFRVGHSTSITISLSNTGDETGNAIIHLWWIGPTMSPGAGPMLDLVNGGKLAPPFGAAHPILFGVLSGGGGKATVSWTPSAADFPKAVFGASVPGCLFAQAEIQVAPPTYPGDTSALTNWSPAYSLCAQRNIHIAT
jgi:hypothetical protein